MPCSGNRGEGTVEKKRWVFPAFIATLQLNIQKKKWVSVEERKTIWNCILVSSQRLREIQAMEYIKKMDVAGIMRTQTCQFPVLGKKSNFSSNKNKMQNEQGRESQTITKRGWAPKRHTVNRWAFCSCGGCLVEHWRAALVYASLLILTRIGFWNVQPQSIKQRCQTLSTACVLFNFLNGGLCSRSS